MPNYLPHPPGFHPERYNLGGGGGGGGGGASPHPWMKPCLLTGDIQKDGYDEQTDTKTENHPSDCSTYALW